MLLSVNTIVHLPVNLELKDCRINSLMEWVFENRQQILQVVVQEVVQQLQEDYLQACRAAMLEWVCRGCGVVHGSGEFHRRGTRTRRLKTSSGEMEFSLTQVTCSACKKTRVAAEELLGLEPRQRISTELERRLVERVYDTSYARSVETARACIGVTVSTSTLHRCVQATAQKLVLTPHPTSEVVVADGTKVRAGGRAELEDLRMAFQIIGRDEEGGRPHVQKRLLGLAVGTRTWTQVLGDAPATKVVVTDAELAVRAHVRDSYPAARHQHCEWHVGHSLNWSLRADGVGSHDRKQLRKELGSIIWGEGSTASRRTALAHYTERLRSCRLSYNQLCNAMHYILFDPESPERTTSVIERQMREVDRRAWIGVRWSEVGLSNLLTLSFAKTHNPDDYERIWT
jgi:hypothetical protein